MNSNVLGEE